MSTNRHRIDAADAPPALGNYVHAMRAGEFVFVSGQGPLDPATGRYRPGTVGEETALTLANVDAIARAAGGTLADAVKICVYLADIATFPEFDAAYRAALPADPPARTTVAAGLRDIQVEIDAILYLPNVPANGR